MKNTNKTIWIINQYAGSPLHGMEFRHYYLSKELISLGYDMNIISASYSHLFTKLPVVTDKFTFKEIDAIRYCWIKTPPYKKSTSVGRVTNMCFFARRLKQLPFEKFKKPAAIIVSSPSLFPVLMAKKFAKKYGAKFIFEVRDIWPLTLKELGNLSSFHPLICYMQYFENYAYQNADIVVSVLPGAKDHMIKRGMKNEKFNYIPNGVNVNELQKEEMLDKKTDLLIPRDKFIIGYAGTIGIANALEYFIEAARLLKYNFKIHFILAGSGIEKQRLKMQSEYFKNVTFIEPVPKNQVSALLERFDACYIGWRRENIYRFGISANKIFDYMLSGKPIIHSVEAFNDPVSESGCGISIPPENPQAIAEAINKLVKMPTEVRLQLGEKGKSYVIKHHSYKALAKKMELLF